MIWGTMFSARVAAQMAAFFLKKHGGAMPVLKLVKLLYLADREAVDQHGMPLTFDRMVSMPHGPVLSGTLDLLNGGVGGPAGEQWEEWIRDREDHNVSLRRDFERSDLDHLSNADLGVLEHVWACFGKMDKWSICKYTHDNCAEWVDPNGSSVPITDEALLSALHKDPDEATEIAADIAAHRKLVTLLAAE